MNTHDHCSGAVCGRILLSWIECNGSFKIGNSILASLLAQIDLSPVNVSGDLFVIQLNGSVQMDQGFHVLHRSCKQCSKRCVRITAIGMIATG